MEKLLAKIEKYALYITVFLLPVTVLTITSNPFTMPKLIILVYGVLIALLARCLRIIVTGKIDLKISRFDLPVLFIAVAYLLSTILRTPNKMEAFLSPGTATAVIGGALLYFLVNQMAKEEKKSLSLLLFGSGVLYTLITLIAITGVATDISSLPALFRAQGFSPEGGYLPSFIFLASVLPFGISYFLIEKQSTRKILFGVATFFVGLGVITSLYNILPGQTYSPKFPSSSVSWSIAVDSLKTSPILGVGPGNYLTAFNRFRPIEFNASELWAIKFATARTFFFTMMTEAGLLATAGLIFLLFVVYKTAKKDLKEQKLVNWGVVAMTDLISLSIILLSLFLFPATALIIMLFFLYLSFYSKSRSTSLDLTAKGSQDSSAAVNEVATRFPALLITLPIIAAVLYLGFFSSRVVTAEYKFVKSLNALSQNDAQATYDLMKEAIDINPYVDRYHATFARINLALANSIAINAQQEGATVTDQDRNNITILIQQAIAESKSTVALNPFRAGSWEILAQIYRSIMPLAEGADAFAVQSYRQAVALDPLNPNLRIALGGIFYAAGDFESAVSIFRLAVATKPDHANARYNLAFALNELGNVEEAISEMTAVLSLITDKTGEDFRIAQQALSDMQAKKAASGDSSQQLTPPQPAEESLLEPPLDLPEGSEPPEAVITPTPIPSAEEDVTEPTPTPLP